MQAKNCLEISTPPARNRGMQGQLKDADFNGCIV